MNNTLKILITARQETLQKNSKNGIRSSVGQTSDSMICKKVKMNILVACDSVYVMPLTVMLASLFYNNKDVEFDVYLLQSRLTDEEINILKEFVSSWNNNIIFIKVDAIFTKEDLPISKWPVEAYYRLLAGELLPANLDKILWLDCDMILNKSIKGLYDIDLEGNCLGAVENPGHELRKIQLDIPATHQYFNSGMLLYDLELYRQNISLPAIFNLLKLKKDFIKSADQDILNAIFYDKVKFVNEKYNDCFVCNYNFNLIMRILNKVDISDTVIIHYLAGKPWDRIYSGALDDLWCKYLLMTPYKDLYYSRYKTFKYRLLRSRLMKFVFNYFFKLVIVINHLLVKYLPNSHIKIRNLYRKYLK